MHAVICDRCQIYDRERAPGWSCLSGRIFRMGQEAVDFMTGASADRAQLETYMDLCPVCTNHIRKELLNGREALRTFPTTVSVHSGL